VSWTTWEPAPFVLGGAGLMLALFAGAFVRLRRRGCRRHATWPRAALFALAIAGGTLALVSALDEAGDHYLLSAHMLQHVVIGDAAPALALVALRGPLLFFLLPRRAVRRLARLGPLRHALAFVLRPHVSLAAWMLVIAAWHIPAAYDYALTSQTVHELEHVSFIAVGLLAWTQLVDPARRLSCRERLGCMAAMAGFALVLGAALITASPLYPSYAHESVRLFGIGPARDQQLAGLIMIGEQLLALGLCAWFLVPGRVELRHRPLLPHSPLSSLWRPT
jgi:cytochrome c oxidase assembly factor CtaG